MKLLEFLTQRIPEAVLENRVYLLILTADGLALSAVPIVGNRTPQQLIDLMISEDSFFSEYLGCEVLENDGENITINWRLNHEKVERYFNEEDR